MFGNLSTVVSRNEFVKRNHHVFVGNVTTSEAGVSAHQTFDTRLGYLAAHLGVVCICWHCPHHISGIDVFDSRLDALVLQVAVQLAFYDQPNILLNWDSIPFGPDNL